MKRNNPKEIEFDLYTMVGAIIQLHGDLEHARKIDGLNDFAEFTEREFRDYANQNLGNLLYGAFEVYRELKKELKNSGTDVREFPEPHEFPRDAQKIVDLFLPIIKRRKEICKAF
ncbi:MAG: hypothetical protein ACOYT4_02090 [Nanoarchaeota archaeon]